MNEELVCLEIQGPCAHITLNRPKQLNPLNIQVLEQLDALVAKVEANTALRCLVITGAGERSFVAGADISMMGGALEDPSQGKSLVELGHRVFNRIEALQIPVIAAVNGFCFGGGLELALCCDFRIACASAKFALPEITLGIVPGWGGTTRLPRIIGEGRAKDMVYRGTRINAETALQYGLVTQVYDDVEALRAGTSALAEELCAKATRTLAADKEMIQRSMATPSAQIDGLAMAYCFTTQDAKEGITAFLEKRTATFQGK